MPRELAGRATELDSLARAGEPGLCVVGGEAGIGRTALLREFGARAAAAGGRVLIGRCGPAAAGPHLFAPVLEALRPVATPSGSPTTTRPGAAAPGAGWPSCPGRAR